MLEGNILFGLNIHNKKMKIKQSRDSYETVIVHLIPEFAPKMLQKSLI